MTTMPLKELTEPVRPEALLDRFNRVLRRLHAAAAAIDDRKAEQLTRDVLRQTLTTQVISESYLVAVAGMQGAGKTTLVRQLYDLGFGWLPENLGIGERMPVFVVENTSLDAPRGFAVEFGDSQHGSSLLNQVEISGDAWLEGLRGRRDQLIARLEVPPRIFGVDGAGLLLLPGFEPHGEPEWQNLMEQALVASPSTVVVTDPADLASPTAVQVMDQMREQYLAGRRPIVVVSRCEGTGAERAEELKQSAGAAFHLAPDDIHANVILSGDTDEFRARWRPALRKALRENARSGEEARRKQVRHLRGVVRDQGADLLDRFTDALQEWLASNDTSDLDYRDQLRHFDEEARVVHGAFRQLIGHVLNTQLSDARERIKGFVEETEGWAGLYSRFIDFIRISQVASQDELLGTLEKAWQDSEDDDFNNKLQKVRDDAISRVLGYVVDTAEVATQAAQRAEPGGSDDSTLGPTMPAIANSAGGEEAPLSLDQIVQEVGDLGRLAVDDRAMVTTRAMRLLPAIAYELMAFSATQASPLVVGDVPAEAEQWESVLIGLSTQRRQLLTALVGFVGIDIAEHGQVESITALAQALHGAFNPNLAAGAAVSSVASSAAGVLVGIASFATLLNYANRFDGDRRRTVMSILGSIRDAQWTRLDEAFLESTLQIRQIIAARLRVYYHVDDQRDRIWVLQKVISDLRQARSDLLEACGADLTALG